jgi:hypothetical protein
MSGQPNAAFLSPHACPYSGFSNVTQNDDLLRCLRSPIWFTFSPPGSQAGGSVLATGDRPVAPAVAGASISLVRLPVAADYVPANHGALAPVAQVAEQVNLKVPSNLATGLYEAVVSCPRCAPSSSGTASLYPAGSILVTAKQKTPVGIRIVSYALTVVVIAAAVLAVITYRRRRRLRAAAEDGRGGSSRR